MTVQWFEDLRCEEHTPTTSYRVLALERRRRLKAYEARTGDDDVRDAAGLACRHEMGSVLLAGHRSRDREREAAVR
jgi:hypothetical protein